MTNDDLIRRIDDVELPTAGWWEIAAHQPVTLQAGGWRRRVVGGTASGGLTIAEEPLGSTLDLLVCPHQGRHPDGDLVITASLASATPDGVWRFTGTASGIVTVPVNVDVRYHGVFRNADRAAAWLTVRVAVPGVGVRGAVALRGELNADSPASGT